MVASRDERRVELRGLLQTHSGQQKIERMFAACFPAGMMPPIGASMIETILDHEFSRRIEQPMAPAGVMPMSNRLPDSGFDRW